MKILAALLLPAAIVLSLAFTASPGPQERKFGYDDTPFLPDGQWRVHDGSRPQAPVVTPGLGGAPPSDAIVLFDGTGLEAWERKEGGDARWKLADGAMEANRTGTIETREHFGDVQLHVEWATPVEIKAEGQARGNSGVFLMGLYEIQILDSFENLTYADGQAGAVYGQAPPLVNASRGPGDWQSFDIVFRAPRFEDGELVSPAVVTVLHNGVVVQHAFEILGAAAHGTVGRYSPHPPEGPIRLQDHGYPSRFRNVWVRRL